MAKCRFRVIILAPYFAGNKAFMKKVILIAIIILGYTTTKAQSKLANKLFSKDTTRHNSFLPVPVIGYTQEAGFEFGAAGLFSFYVDKKDSIIRPSQLYGIAYTSTKGQTQVSTRADIWSRQNKFHHFYELRYFNIPFNFYGVGDETLRANEDELKQQRFRVNAEVERKVTPFYYPGIGFEYETQSYRDIEEGGIYGDPNQPFIDRTGGQFLFLKLTQLIDTRNTNTYTTKGFYTRLRYGYAPKLFKEEDFTGSLFTADARYFYTPTKKITLASQFVYETVSSKKEIPFYLLRQMGNEQIMRGYYLGRYRDKNYMAIQAEIKYRIIERIGIVAFGGTGSAYAKGVSPTDNLKPNYGIGTRIFFDLDKSLALRLDYGWGEKPAGEKRISGLYISLGESF